MIVFRQKEFNIPSIKTVDILVTSENGEFFKQVPLNIMKAIEMMWLDDGEYVNHWIDEMVVKEVLLKMVKSSIPPQIAFIALEDDSATKSKVLGGKSL